ncbi:Alpha-ribazole phosphatase [Corynebacterium atrinae]|uniref:histidine phosphatase family protein n=1 Tax=Corynebacterium atrinae TaxID=1336740 RepID=UPI0025B51279|nr:histidine phosphatase family protein [Corynebacterium atrinae]WJY64555.1 Alpha-ribazole phosphatase [Corynebacterium atrinae]
MPGRLILLRHGQTHSNVNRRLDTRPPGAELTAKGRAQAREVGFELAKYSRLSTVASSVALRAQQTAVLAVQAYEEAAGLPEGSQRIDVLPGVHEIFAGDLELRSDEKSQLHYYQALRGWLGGDEFAATPGGETYGQVLDRFQPVLEGLVEDNLADGQEDDVLVVSHGAAIRTVAAHASGVDPDYAFASYLGNCRFIVLDPVGKEFGSWDILRWADGDLPG